MSAPSSGQLNDWASAVNALAPFCPPNLKAACYTLATTIAGASAPSDATMEAWAVQIWNFAATFSTQQWSQANTTAVSMVVQAGGATQAINFTAVLVQAGMPPNQAKAIADYFVANIGSGGGGGGGGGGGSDFDDAIWWWATFG